MQHPKGWANGGTFSDECEGARAAEALSQSAARRVATEGSGGTLPVGLSLSAATVSALLQTRRSRFGASGSWATIEPGAVGRVQSGGTGSPSGELSRIRPDAGGGEADARWFGSGPCVAAQVVNEGWPVATTAQTQAAS